MEKVEVGADGIVAVIPGSGLGTGVVLAAGLVVPPDDSVGYSTGCLFVHSDGPSDRSRLYANSGTPESSDFEPLGINGYLVGDATTPPAVYVGSTVVATFDSSLITLTAHLDASSEGLRIGYIGSTNYTTTPTIGETNDAFGAAGTYGDGFIGVMKDSGANVAHLCVTAGGAWYNIPMTLTLA